MEEQQGAKGVYAAEVHLLKEKSNFQIFRDRDWDQGFYPGTEAGADAEILGPDGLGQGKNWQMAGKVGDVFRVEFQRRVRREEDRRAIRWEWIRFEEVDFEALDKSNSYGIVGSWNQFQNVKVMHRDDTGLLWQEIIVGKTGEETFQILLNDNWLAALHPNVNHATMGADHALEGPDDAGSGKYWLIGAGQGQDIGPGDHAKIYLQLDGGKPCRVWWEKYDSPDVHQEYLAAGAQRVFERHMRLMGLVAYESEKPGRLLNPPEWYSKSAKQALSRTEKIVLNAEMLTPSKVPEDKLPHEG